MNITQLYLNNDFDNYILKQCWRKKLDYDDSKQDIFLEIVEEGADTYKRCIQIANAYFQREFNKNRKVGNMDHIDFDTIEDGRDYSSLWEDNHIVGVG